MLQQYWTSQSSLDMPQFSDLSIFMFIYQEYPSLHFLLGYLHIFWVQVQNHIFLEDFFMYFPTS